MAGGEEKGLIAATWDDRTGARLVRAGAKDDSK